jgi:hypothetical protein
MSRVFKILSATLLVYAAICVLTPFVATLRVRSIENQITYLSALLDDGYDDTLQEKFPEGKMFSNALLSLSIIEYADGNDIRSKHYASIVDKCISRMLSDEARISFDARMEPKYGMFYNGWTLLVINTYRDSKLSELSMIDETLAVESARIERRLQDAQNDTVRILDTYFGTNWPADNLIGIVPLKNGALKNDWLNVLLETTEDEDGLIHHAGFSPPVACGSSSALITYCLGKINPELAKDYNTAYRDKFVDSFLDIDLVLEHSDRSNVMDVDSGPVLFGYGASATVMNVKTQASLGRINGKCSWALLNLIGLPVNALGQKFYLLQQEPMLDLFLLWGAVEL